MTGANRGLGLETCRQLGRHGLRVILTSRGPTGADVARVLTQEGLDVLHRVLDVSDAASIAVLSTALRHQGVTVDVLVNNAAVSLSGFDGEIARRTLAVNFFGALHVTDALLDLIPSGGNIVMVSSGYGELSRVGPRLREVLTDPALTRDQLISLMHSFVGAIERGSHAEAGWPSSAYAVSKVAMNALVRILAPELAARSIRVNAVTPGWVRTDMGGACAERSIDEGAASILWAAASADGPTGGFFRDGEPLAW